MTSMEKSVQVRLGWIAGAGMASLALTLGGYYWFLTAEFFTTTIVLDKTTWDGYTLAQLFGLCLFTLFNPIAFTCLFVTAQTLIRHYSDVSVKAVTITAAICVAIFIAFGIYGITNSVAFLECMGVGCIGEYYISLLSTTKSLYNMNETIYGWKVTIGVSLMFVCFLFAMVFAAIGVRARKTHRPPADGAPVSETERLSLGISSSNDVVAPHHPRSAWRWLAYAAYVVAMLAWWVPTAIIPASWEYFEPSRIAYNAALYAAEVDCGSMPPRACAELANSTWQTSNLAISEYFVMKIFPSSIIFFAFWIITPGLALLAYDIASVRHFMHRKLRLCGTSFFSYGELAVGAAFALMLGMWSYYWFHDHNYHGRTASHFVSGWEKLYRGLGQVSVLLMAVLMLPAARSGILGAFFRISWEATIQYHRWIGTFWLVTVIGHILFYFVYVSAVTGTLSTDWFPLHFSGSTDNFTVPLQIVFTYISIVTMGVFAYFDYFRRKFFELFFYTHHISYCFLILTVLWHAAAAWMYLTPAVALWFFDRMLRAYRSSRSVRVAQFRAVDCGKAGQVVELVCEVAGGMPYKAGQYAFLNIAELSILEWHPFTIASATAHSITFLIKAMGEGEPTWSRKLYQLALNAQKADGDSSSAKVTLCIDGPIGEPIDMRHYDSVLLVSGGIGVTPCMSLLEALRKQPQPSPAAHFFWVVRDAQLLSLLGDRLIEVAKPLDADAIAVDPEAAQPAYTATLFVGGVSEKPGKDELPVRVAPVAPAAAEAAAHGGEEEKKELQARAVRRLQQAGRPATDANWTATLAPLAARRVPANRTLLFVCGPDPMIRQMERIAHEQGWDFHTEVFDL